MKTRKFASNKVLSLDKYQNLCNKVSDKPLVDELIKKYQENTKSAVLNIINMSLAVQEVVNKVKLNYLKEADLNYFCASVALDKKSSTFRKYLCIADKAEIFMKYLEKLPASYTILCEIMTLDSEKFERLVTHKRFTNFITLNEVKAIADKIPVSQPHSNFDSIVIKFDQSLISSETRALLKSVLKQVSAVEELKVSCSTSFEMSAELKQAA